MRQPKRSAVRSEWGLRLALVLSGVAGLAFFFGLEPHDSGTAAANRFDAAVLNAVTFFLCILTYSVYRQAARGVDAALLAVNLNERERNTAHAPYLTVKVDQTVDDTAGQTADTGVTRRVIGVNLTVTNVGKGPAISVQVSVDPIVWSVVELATPFPNDVHLRANLIVKGLDFNFLRFDDGRESFTSYHPLIMQGHPTSLGLPLPVALSYPVNPGSEIQWGWQVQEPPLNQEEFHAAAGAEVVPRINLLDDWTPNLLIPGYLLRLSYTGIGLNDPANASDEDTHVEETYCVLLDSRNGKEAHVALRDSVIPYLNFRLETPTWQRDETTSRLAIPADSPNEVRERILEVNDNVSISALDEARTLAQLAVSYVRSLNWRDGVAMPDVDEKLLASLDWRPYEYLLAAGYSQYLVKALTLREQAALVVATETAIKNIRTQRDRSIRKKSSGNSVT